MTYFTAECFRFLADLKTHNDRAWFERNKTRYERHVRAPMLQFIGDLARPLGTIAPRVQADPKPVGGSMFRIHRDVRFSRDKSPYKTNVGAHFPHAGVGRDAHAPGFYLHLTPGGSFGGGGLWHPDQRSLHMVRQGIVRRSAAWKRIKGLGHSIEGDALKRVPAGFDAAHPFADDLKLRDFYIMRPFTDREVCSPSFMNRFLGACKDASPLVSFLSKCLNLAW
jgi:uncharacterized protein (TIGR02453 family)